MANQISKPIVSPSSIVPVQAVGYGGANEAAILVGDATPLPVEARPMAARSQALAGAAAASGVIGPFVPDLGRPIWVQLSGTWAGRVRLLRSTDGGVTRLPLTYPDGSAKAIWSGNLHAAITEESVAGASYYLDVTLASGQISFRVEQ